MQNNNYSRPTTPATQTPLFSRAISLCFALGVAAGTGISVGVQRTANICSPFTAQRYKDKYEHIQIGMNLTDVRAILSDGTEVRQTTSQTILEWNSGNGWNITTTFENDHLIEKVQVPIAEKGCEVNSIASTTSKDSRAL